MQARSLPTDRLRPGYYFVNCIVYLVQVIKYCWSLFLNFSCFIKFLNIIVDGSAGSDLLRDHLDNHLDLYVDQQRPFGSQGSKTFVLK